MEHIGGKCIAVDHEYKRMFAGGGNINNYSYWYARPKKDIITLFSGRTTKCYLRLTKKGIDPYGKENDPCIKFKLHGTGHIRSLESVKNRGKFIRVYDGKIVIGKNDKYAKLKFFTGEKEDSDYDGY